MAVIKNSQLPITYTISQTAYVPIIDLNQPVGSQNQIIPLALVTTPSGTNVTINGQQVTSLDQNIFGFNGNGTTLTFSNIIDIGALDGNTTILVVNNNYTYTTTINELANYIINNYF